MQQVGNDVSTFAELITFDADILGRPFIVDVSRLPSGTAEATAFKPCGTLGVQVYVAPEQVQLDGGDFRATVVRALEKEAYWYAASLDA